MNNESKMWSWLRVATMVVTGITVGIFIYDLYNLYCEMNRETAPVASGDRPRRNETAMAFEEYLRRRDVAQSDASLRICGVCMDPVENVRSDQWDCLECGSVHHNDCLNRWRMTQGHVSCPYCRSKRCRNRSNS